MIKNTTHTGFFIIDKPQDLTSHDVVATIRRLTKLSKVGHTGTLDPFATGILLIPTQSATRLTPYTHDLQKTYEATITLGATSDTDDGTGAHITPVSSRKPSLAEIELALTNVRGEIEQLPPQYAAIKIKGKKMYEYARAGQTIEAKPRKVTIHEIDILSYTYPHLIIRATVSTGTYIRSLGRDIGQILKTGGYVSTLRRTSIGNFNEQQAIKLTDLTSENWSQHLHEPSKLIAHMSTIMLDEENVAKFQQGRAVHLSQGSASLLNPEQTMAVLDSNNTVIGIGIYTPSTSLLSPKTVLTF